MKLAGAQIERFLQNPPASLLGVLIYGPDAGLVTERSNQLIQKQVLHPDDPFNSVDFQADSIKEDSARLYDELAAIGCGEGKRLIRVRDAGNTHTKLLEASLSNPPSGSETTNFVVVTAGDIDRGSLRSLFENTPHLAAIPCYSEEGAALANIAFQKFKTLSLEADRDVANYLAEHAKGDRGLMLQAVEKLSLYAGERRQVVIEDAIAVIGDAGEASQDDIEAAMFTGNPTRLQEVMDAAFQQGLNEVMLLRGLMRSLTRLHQVRGRIEGGSSLDEAMKALRPPVFFKAVPQFRQQLNILRAVPSKRLWQWHQSLYQAELAAKGGQGRLVEPELICRHTLTSIARQIAALQARNRY